MAENKRKQHRRCVSVSPSLYAKLVAHKEQTGTPFAQVVERSVTSFLDLAEAIAKVASKEANEEVAKLAMTLPTGEVE